MSEVEKTRSAEKEADLDRKIQEIRRRNEELEERHKIVTEEAKQNGVPKSFQKATVHGGGGQQQKSGSNHANLKTSETISSPNNKKGGNGIVEPKGNQWSREWDRGKTSAEDWKMNVPEFGDHGNSYFKTESSNGSGNSSSSSRGGQRGGPRGGGHQQQQRGGRRPGAAPGAQNGGKQQPQHNPGFFHDDRCDKNKADENGAADSVAPGSNDGKSKFPARNNNPRKPTSNHKLSDNDKNQNDSSKPNMNVSNNNGFGPRQDRRGGGGAAQPSRNNFNNQPSRRGGAAMNGSGGAGFRQPHHQNNTNGVNGDQTAPSRKPIQKTENGKAQNIKDAANPTSAVERQQQRSGPTNRGRNFKPFNKPAHYSNPHQSKGPLQQKSSRPSNNTNGSKPQQNPKLDKDGQAVKRLIDNIIDQVVRQERKEQKKSEEEEDEKIVEEKQGVQSKSSEEDDKNAIPVNEEKKIKEKPKSEEETESENAGGEKAKNDETQNRTSKIENENESKKESNDAEKPIPEGNNNETKSGETDGTESKTPESHTENAQKQQQPEKNTSDIPSEG